MPGVTGRTHTLRGSRPGSRFCQIRLSSPGLAFPIPGYWDNRLSVPARQEKTMGFLDKLLGRRKSEAGEAMKTAPSPASMPAEDTHEHLPGEAMKTAPPPASMTAEDTRAFARRGRASARARRGPGLERRRHPLTLPERTCGPVACVTSVEGARTLGVARLCARSLTGPTPYPSPRPHVAFCWKCDARNTGCGILRDTAARLAELISCKRLLGQ